MFSFPWPSVARNEKILPVEASLLPPKNSAAQMPGFNRMKRKRGDSDPESPHLDFPTQKKTAETMNSVQISVSDAQRAASPLQALGFDRTTMLDRLEAKTSQDLTEATVASHSNAQSHGLSRPEKPYGVTDLDGREASIRHPSARRVSSNVLREAIEAQFGLEILLKHKELRLIDQEFAKCQTALEQLRRCHIVPYSAISASAEAIEAVGSGMGNHVNNRASYAPPWGVIDGPYSRHYQQWLITHSAFDDTIIENAHVSTRAGKTIPERSTRGSTFEVGTAAGTSRSQRGSTSARLKALPHGYPEPKEEKGPMIVKRGSDGKMVKLVCLDCRRSNFNSAQGFINHCRIAHSRQFQNHETAIEASGEEIDVGAEGLVGEINSAPQTTASSALVHPLIRSSAHPPRTTSIQLSAPSSTERKFSKMEFLAEHEIRRSINSAQSESTPQPAKLASVANLPMFTPSPQTPHLSALFAKLGQGGDLDDMVNQAKARPEIDLSFSSDDEDDDAMEVAAGTTNTSQSRSTRVVVRGGQAPIRQNRSPSPVKQSLNQHCSSNGSQKPHYLSNVDFHRDYPSPYHCDDAQDDHTSVHTSSTPFNLSPNTTEAHTAPSLVSDDGDYGNTLSESESPSSAENDDDDDHYIHAEFMDQDEIDLGQGSSTAHHIGLGGKPHTPVVRRRSSAMGPPMSLHHGERRHVSFASPTRRQRRNLRTPEGKQGPSMCLD